MPITGEQETPISPTPSSYSIDSMASFGRSVSSAVRDAKRPSLTMKSPALAPKTVVRMANRRQARSSVTKSPSDIEDDEITAATVSTAHSSLASVKQSSFSSSTDASDSDSGPQRVRPKASSLDQIKSVRGARSTVAMPGGCGRRTYVRGESDDDSNNNDNDNEEEDDMIEDAAISNHSTRSRRRSMQDSSSHQRQLRRMSTDSSMPSTARRRTIQFRNQVRVRKCLHHLSYTDEEWENTWYTDFEMDRIKLKTQRMLDGIERGEYPVQRGLECHTREGSEKRNIHKEATRQAVLDEQDYQRCNGMCVPEAIARASNQTSVSSRTQALIMGMMDHQCIAKELEEELAKHKKRSKSRSNSCHSRRTRGSSQRRSSSTGRRRRRSTSRRRRRSEKDSSSSQRRSRTSEKRRSSTSTAPKDIPLGTVITALERRP